MTITSKNELLPTQNQTFSPKLNYINYIEHKFFPQTSPLLLPFVNSVEKSLSYKNLSVGSLIKIGYTIFEGNKERIQYFEGLIISKKNRGAGKTFTIRRTVQGIGVEQVFLVGSPKIKSIVEKQSFQVRRAKLYFFRFLKKKASKLKAKI